MKVAIIGAGAAGLCCARHLRRYPEYFQFQVLEKMNEVGGTWVFSPTTNEGLVHSSIYKNLKTNLPKEIMSFPDFPFPSHLQSFVHHSEVLKYLQSYASHFDLNRFIKLGTRVDQITPIFSDTRSNGTDTRVDNVGDKDLGRFEDKVKWRVTTQDVESKQITVEEYDAVLVCNGHFSAPKLPVLAGLSLFPGRVVHSHDYREPEVYRDQSVLVVGSGQSGRDIILDLSTCAEQVYISNRGPLITCHLPSNVEQLCGIASVGDDGTIQFMDGQKKRVDSIVLATGYEYSFPFLSEKVGVDVKDGKRVTPVYKQTFNISHPSMAFIGLNFGFNPFPYFDYQVRWVISVWTGGKILPSLEDMLKDEEEWYQNRLQSGLPTHKAGHYLGTAQWDMINLFAKLAGHEPQPPVIKMLYEDAFQGRTANLMQYKTVNYMVLSKSKWAQTFQ